MILRFVTPQDCPALLDIYAQYIDTGVTVEYDLPTREEFTARISGRAMNRRRMLSPHKQLVRAHKPIPW